MKNPSLTQEYFMCVVNEKGRTVPSALVVNHSTITVCLIVSGVSELLKNEYLTLDQTQAPTLPTGLKQLADAASLTINKPLGEDFAYLKPIYDFIADSKEPVGIKNIALAFYSEYSTKHLDKLLSAMGEFLMKTGYADELPAQGFLNKKIRYAPKVEFVDSIIHKIRTEFLNNDSVSEEVLSLAALLDKSTVINAYFDKKESDAFKERIKEVRNSTKYTLLKDVKRINDLLDGPF